MKKLVLWGSIIGIGYLLGSCSVANNQETIAEPEDPVIYISNEELKKQFGADQLSDAQLLAFENKAIDQLKDYIDYVNILINPSMDSTFKEQAFISIQQINPGYKDLDYNEFMSSISSDDSRSYSIREIRVIEPLYSLQDFYTGQIAFTLVSEHDEAVNHSLPIYVRKEVKEFGDQQEILWKVSLAELNFRKKPDDN